MTSPARVVANRHNSTKSTGPRTARGKASSALNRLSHGLRGAAVTIPGEDPDEWDGFREQIVAALAPADRLEVELAERVAVSLWRMRRAGALEAVHTNIEAGLVAARASRDGDESSAAMAVADAERFAGWKQDELDALGGPSSLAGLMDLPDTAPLNGEQVERMFEEFTTVGDTGFDCTRRKFLLAAGLPEAAVGKPFEWAGWTAGLVRKALDILAKNQNLDTAAVIAEAVEGRNTRRAEVRAGVAAAEQKVRDAQEAARLVEARRLLKSALPIGDVYVLLQRYEGHHARQMAEAIRTLDTLRRAKAAKVAGGLDRQDPTPAAAS